MTDNLITFFSSHGLPGVVIAALFIALYTLIKQGSEERRVWLNTFIKTSEIADARQQETNEVIRTLTAVIERHRS